jgi:cation diffusion facilitator family transporter
MALAFKAMTKPSASVQKTIFGFTLILFVIKFVAWWYTRSISIFTDMLEYTINVVTAAFGLYSLRLAATPKDRNHPYGHGKIEYISSTIEAVLMIASAVAVVWHAIRSFAIKQNIVQLDLGLALILATGIANYYLGTYALNYGKKNNSLALVATGKHIHSDTYATIAIFGGLLIMYFTHWAWIDPLMGVLMAGFVAYEGFKILRQAIAGIMDEEDPAKISQLADVLEKNRDSNWIDVHHARFAQYGATLHLDVHITLPWFFTVKEAHKEIDQFVDLITQSFDQSVEVSTHMDYCTASSCHICTKTDCSFRKHPLSERLVWTRENLGKDSKHRLDQA